eukprot:gene12265-biopygen8573
MAWGYQAGPEFLTKKCVIDGVSQFPQMFCTDESTAERCTEGHLTMGRCNLMTRSEDLPSYFQYFSDPKKGGAQDYAESCPFIQGFYKSDCRYSNDCLGPCDAHVALHADAEHLGGAEDCEPGGRRLAVHDVRSGAVRHEHVRCEVLGRQRVGAVPRGVDGAAVQVQLDVCEWHPDVPALCCDVRCYG